ncbi:hypothetical protein RRG08_020313 [Elysia crispata]|uniref:Uncharacterized protein n=1 Tax=Elysia crispata TaxID=231223 RepID=A0AAE1CW02_9GAST|nr:hypothetical protein RRG08_020313 [Elysia crispata]
MCYLNISTNKVTFRGKDGEAWFRVWGKGAGEMRDDKMAGQRGEIKGLTVADRYFFNSLGAICISSSLTISFLALGLATS